jgi:hypothetical protein
VHICIVNALLDLLYVLQEGEGGEVRDGGGNRRPRRPYYRNYYPRGGFRGGYRGPPGQMMQGGMSH